MLKTITYLALGDSYTIGEGVPLYHSFPYQTVQQLRQQGLPLGPPEILAKTGWTTDELGKAVQDYRFLAPYDLVSLLIGVNNQYRGRTAGEYRVEFENLLKIALDLAGGNRRRIFVLSIPDYGLTPFGQSLDPDRIRKELDEFNRINREISERYYTYYIDITAGSREGKDDPGMVAGDGLHPSAKAYAQWAGLLADRIATELG